MPKRACPHDATRPPLPAAWCRVDTLHTAAYIWQRRSAAGRARLLERARRFAAQRRA